MRDKKKAKFNTRTTSASRNIAGEVIVIESSDDDDIEEVPAVRPAPKPLQTEVDTRPQPSASSKNVHSEVRHTTTVLADISAPVCTSWRICETDHRDQGRSVKSEPLLGHQQPGFGTSSGLLEHSSLSSSLTHVEGGRQPSPFGSPSLLAGDIKPSEPPTRSIDCSHDRQTSSLVLKVHKGIAVEDIVGLGAGDKNTGNDDVDLFDVDTDIQNDDGPSVDIDLTLDDEDQGPSGPFSRSTGRSHDGTTGGLIPQAEEVNAVEYIIDAGDWGTGDDELELLDVDAGMKIEDAPSADIDLTLGDEDPSEFSEQMSEYVALSLLIQFTAHDSIQNFIR